MLTSSSSNQGMPPISEWPFDRSYRALSYHFRVRTNLARAGFLLDRLLAPFRASTSKEVPTYDLVQTNEGQYPFSLYLDGSRVQQVESASSMLDFVLANVTVQAVELMEDFVALHAAAAAWGGRGIIFPGPPDAGKTTLVAGLTRIGFAYLTDEAALIDPRTGFLHPFPRALAMDERSIDVIPGLRQKLPPDHDQFMRYRYHVPPDDLRPGAVGRPCRVEFVIAPRYEAGGETVLEPMSRAEALMMLAENSFNFVRFGGKAVESLRQAMDGVKCYRLRTGTLEDSIRSVFDVVGGDVARTGRDELAGDQSTGRGPVV
jgi:hypothetical protein